MHVLDGRVRAACKQQLGHGSLIAMRCGVERRRAVMLVLAFGVDVGTGIEQRFYTPACPFQAA